VNEPCDLAGGRQQIEHGVRVGKVGIATGPVVCAAYLLVLIAFLAPGRAKRLTGAEFRVGGGIVAAIRCVGTA
jgi:hypothetical protein